MIADTVYLLCTATSLASALLLFRAYARSRMRLLLWSSICFFALTVNNLLLFLDLVVFPDTDLTVWRNLAALIGMGFLLYGLIWDVD